MVCKIYPRPPVSRSPENVLEMQTVGSHLRNSESETLTKNETQQSVFHQALQKTLCMITVYNHCSPYIRRV